MSAGAGGPLDRIQPVSVHLWCLYALLAAYALLGKGAAYLGVGPIYIGDAVLFAGIPLLLLEARSARIPIPLAPGLALAAFLAWHGAIALAGLGRYGIDALRDSVVFGYALAGVIVYTALVGRPDRLRELYRLYARFVPVFLLTAPILLSLAVFAPRWFPAVPGAPETVLLKPGDVGVHLVAALAFALTRPGSVPRWSLAVAPISVFLVALSRAALALQLITALILFALRPAVRRGMLIALTVMALVLGALAVLDVEIQDPNRDRVLSTRQILVGMASVVGKVDEGDYEGTKSWRTDWWETIIGYTVQGERFWTGKGYGINLADDDGFQVIGQDANLPTLRNPHNVSMTFLARGGVPGLALWLLLIASGVALLVGAYRRAGDERRDLLLFHALYLGAALLIGSFDVYFEGPTGGIWFWFNCGCLGAVAMTPELDREPA